MQIGTGRQPAQYLPPLCNLRYRLRLTTRLDHAPIVACDPHATQAARKSSANAQATAQPTAVPANCPPRVEFYNYIASYLRM